MTTGRVMAVQANYYRVLPDDPHLPSLLCTRRAVLKKTGQTVYVGDRVQVAEICGDRGVISGILARHNCLGRPAIANLQAILIIASLTAPAPDPWQISRFLVHAETCGVPILVGLSKADLVNGELAQAWSDRLQGWGYLAVSFSSTTRVGLSELLSHLPTGITLLTGLSGVGKSSLLNALNPHLNLATSAVSAHSHSGRHTTRHVELFAIGGDRFLADSPGFLQPKLEMLPQDLAQHFPEIRQKLSQHTCLFPDCLHVHEPQCVVRGDWERYEHYLAWLTALQGQSNLPLPSTLSRKIKPPKGSKQRYEPILHKKHRLVSRRSSHIQTAHELQEEL